MSGIKAIETEYRGYRFRSRLEARWAVFFSYLFLQWEYEPEGFNLGEGVYYLPDFRIRSKQGFVTWYEVKPQGVTSDPKFDLFNSRKSAEVVALIDKYPEFCVTGEEAHLLAGDPYHLFCEQGRILCPRCGTLQPHGSAEDMGDWIGIPCWRCDMSTPSGVCDPEWGALVKCHTHKGWVACEPDEWATYQRRIRGACQDARGARFEHGERADLEAW